MLLGTFAAGAREQLRIPSQMLSAETRPASSVSWTHGLVRRQGFHDIHVPFRVAEGKSRRRYVEGVLPALVVACAVLIGFKVPVS